MTEQANGGMDVPVIDSSRDGQPVTWRFWVGHQAAKVEETAMEAVVIGGALVLRNGVSEMVRAYGPGTWSEFERAPMPSVPEQRWGRHS